MHVSLSVTEWMARRRNLDSRSIGFVPTMGALHRGHASLVKRSVDENDVTVVSLFVNPTQFDRPDDLRRYPRTMDEDLNLLRSLGTAEVIAPAADDLYPQGYRFRIEAENLTSSMEGASRPGFFEGVMTVVMKLLNLVSADRAYFGEKDYQQLQIVKEMAADFFLPTEVVACETIRTESGLAESSRNMLLSEAGRTKAAEIYLALTQQATSDGARGALERHGFKVDYVEDHWGRRFAAAWLEGIRLIDNVQIANGR